MLLRAINTQAVLSDFKFTRRIAKAQERQHPDQAADGVLGHALEGAYIEGLRVVAEPVAKVDTADQARGPFSALEKGEGLEGVLGIKLEMHMRGKVRLPPRYRHDESCGLQSSR